ncbi:S-layer homology domain-containing protein [Defluviitalea phaphyphila]|uniref:S-layer homology domain-containing protein n=1 Tax=Defluviitalea phaphyphila TaxID=1473580 RepID=UPI0007308E02|nr:S-layer homology domain-containing protein [Defluviitalea phaphyphila]
MKYFKRVGLAIVLATSMSTSVLAKVNYVDVPESHWAYESIQKVTEKKWMAGNTQQEFKPNESVDYFLFSQIGAKIAGYKDPLVNSDVTEEEKKIYEAAIKKYENILKMYEERFSKWDKSSDEEIAYLLYKGILKEEDLAKFVVENQEGEEAVLSLKREDMAVFVVRLMGKEEEALKNTSSTGFLDDDLISSSAKPYVLYLKNEGIIGGDGTNFNPQDKVTRAVLAKVLADSQNLTSVTEIEDEKEVEDKEEYIQGTVKKIYTNLYYILIQYGDNKQSYYYINKDAKILIKDKETNIETIKEGDMILAKLVKEDNQDKIDEIIILDSLEETNTDNIEDTYNNQDNTNLVENIEISDVFTKEVDGIVEDITANGKIDIRVKYVDYKGDIKEKIETYTVSENAVITKDNEKISFTDINTGDVIISEVKGYTIYKATIMEKNRKEKGTLLEKTIENGINILVVENSEGEITNYKIPSDAIISKKGMDEAELGDLRIGDEISLELEYDKVVSVYARGSYSEVSGIIKEILISSNQSKITLKLDNGTTQTYPLIYGAKIFKKGEGNITIYDLRLGQEVELYLDSLEIEEMTVEDEAEVITLKGYIKEIDFANSYLELETSDDILGTRRVLIEKDVEVFDGTRRLSRRDLKEDMLIVVTLENYGSDKAVIINILSE